MYLIYYQLPYLQFTQSPLNRTVPKVHCSTQIKPYYSNKKENTKMAMATFVKLFTALLFLSLLSKGIQYIINQYNVFHWNLFFLFITFLRLQLLLSFLFSIRELPVLFEQPNNQPKGNWISDPWNDRMESHNKQQLPLFSIGREIGLHWISNYIKHWSHHPSHFWLWVFGQQWAANFQFQTHHFHLCIEPIIPFQAHLFANCLFLKFMFHSLLSSFNQNNVTHIQILLYNLLPFHVYHFCNPNITKFIIYYQLYDVPWMTLCLVVTCSFEHI